MKPSRRSCGWLASTLALCVTQASAGDIAFRDNFETHLYYGWPVPFAGSTTVSASTVLAYKVNIPGVTTLDRFGLFAVTSSSDFTLALYADAAGVPGTLEYSTMPASMTTGPNEIYAPYATLAGGVHWLALRVTANTVIASDPAQTGDVCYRNFSIPNIDSPWPSSFGSVSCETDNLMNLYLITFNP